MALECRYLTEELLGVFLRERLSGETTHTPRMIIKGKITRPDYVNEKHKLAIEFDGYFHYTRAVSANRDTHKTELLENAGYTVIRIPYFIQLDKYVIRKLFSRYMINTSTFNLYPHGFIDKHAVLPANYCELGVLRFYADVARFGPRVEKAIEDSLWLRVERGLDRFEVFPAREVFYANEQVEKDKAHKIS